MKIVLACSSGLDTSVLLSWIKEGHDVEITAFCANVWQKDGWCRLGGQLNCQMNFCGMRLSFHRESQ